MAYLHQVRHLPCVNGLLGPPRTHVHVLTQCVYQCIVLLEFSIVAQAMHLLYIPCIVDFAPPKCTSLLELVLTGDINQQHSFTLGCARKDGAERERPPQPPSANLVGCHRRWPCPQPLPILPTSLPEICVLPALSRNPPA
jgi:hypothetical protein